jgi:SHS2 domain-containing protein
VDYEYFDHTADIGVKAYGDDLPQMFQNAAKALVGIIFELGEASEEKVLKVELSNQEEGYEQLLIDWLNEVLYLIETENIVPLRFDVKELDGKRLLAEVAGGRNDPGIHRYKTEVKSATYHMLEIGREKDKYFGMILFDI